MGDAGSGATLTPCTEEFRRDVKGRPLPSQIRTHLFCIVTKQLGTMPSTLPLQASNSLGDCGSCKNDGGTLIVTRRHDRMGDSLDVMSINALHMPIGHLKTLGYILTNRKVCTAIISDGVVVHQ